MERDDKPDRRETIGTIGGGVMAGVAAAHTFGLAARTAAAEPQSPSPADPAIAATAVVFQRGCL